MKLPALVSSVIALTVSIAVWWYGTDGFRAYTSETARRVQVLQQPFQLPNITFKNQNNQTVRFDDYHGKIILTDFIYTNCADVCHSLGYAFKDLQKKLTEKGWLDKVKIVSISFDTTRDQQAQLQDYLERYTEDTLSWNALRLKTPEKLDELLNSFGVVVLKNDWGGYEHNAAIHIIDKNGQLSGIYDYQSINQVLTVIEKRINNIQANSVSYEI